MARALETAILAALLLGFSRLVGGGAAAPPAPGARVAVHRTAGGDGVAGGWWGLAGSLAAGGRRRGGRFPAAGPPARAEEVEAPDPEDQAAAALAESERKYRTLVENAGEAIFVAQEGRLVFANLKTEELLGYSGEELLSRPFTDFIHPDDRELVLQRHTRRMEGMDAPGEYSFRIVNRAGETRWADLRTVATVWQGGPATLNYARDASAQKLAEAQLKLQATALGAAANAIVITDPAGHIIWVNRAFTERTGYALGEAVGRTPGQLLRSGEHPAGYFRDLWETILAGRVWQGEIINRRKDGCLYIDETTITPLLDDTGRVTHFIAIKQDITERKRNEIERNQMMRQISEQAVQMLRIMQNVPAGVVLLGDEGEVLLSNARAEEEFARDPGATVDGRLIRLGDRPLPVLLNPPEPLLRQEVLVADRQLEVVTAPVDPGSPTAGWVLVFQDVTRERAVRQQLERQERLAAVGQLAAGIAHDFNNIVQVIILQMQLLRRSPRVNPEERHNLQTVHDKALQAAALIQRILDFSRRTALDLQPIDLVQLCREEATLLQRTLPRGITVTFQHDGSDCRVKGDGNRLRQVITNVAVNARDAMPAGGHLRLSLSWETVSGREPAPASNVPPGDWVRLEMADTGSGMDAEVLRHAFEPFFTTKPPGIGTGLGLSQVHGIIGQHGGQVVLQSKTGQGTRVIIHLPAIGHAPLPPAPPSAPPGPGTSSTTILVVEDDDAVRSVLVQILMAMGYRCLQAANGARAVEELEAAEPGHIHLVLSDWRMPEMDGAELFQALQVRGWKLPMILVSAYPPGEHLHALLDQGLAGWLTKPLDLARLADLVARTLAERRSVSGPPPPAPGTAASPA